VAPRRPPATTTGHRRGGNLLALLAAFSHRHYIARRQALALSLAAGTTTQRYEGRHY
jgi:hypothetical protein